LSFKNFQKFKGQKEDVKYFITEALDTLQLPIDSESGSLLRNTALFLLLNLLIHVIVIIIVIIIQTTSDYHQSNCQHLHLHVISVDLTSPLQKSFTYTYLLFIYNTKLTNTSS